jgi:hypothetical protein
MWAPDGSQRHRGTEQRSDGRVARVRKIAWFVRTGMRLPGWSQRRRDAERRSGRRVARGRGEREVRTRGACVRRRGEREVRARGACGRRRDETQRHKDTKSDRMGAARAFGRSRGLSTRACDCRVGRRDAETQRGDQVDASRAVGENARFIRAAHACAVGENVRSVRAAHAGAGGMKHKGTKTQRAERKKRGRNKGGKTRKGLGADHDRARGATACCEPMGASPRTVPLVALTLSLLLLRAFVPLCFIPVVHECDVQTARERASPKATETLVSASLRLCDPSLWHTNAPCERPASARRRRRPNELVSASLRPVLWRTNAPCERPASARRRRRPNQRPIRNIHSNRNE